VKQLAKAWKSLRWVALLGYSTGVLVLGTLPQNGGLPRFNDKLLHFAVFGGMGGLAVFALLPFWRANWRQQLRQVALRAMLFAASVGALLEILQAFAPGRSAEVQDWVADCVGILPGVALACWALARGSVKQAGKPQP
jgi:VanZ family protein